LLRSRNRAVRLISIAVIATCFTPSQAASQNGDARLFPASSAQNGRFISAHLPSTAKPLQIAPPQTLPAGTAVYTAKRGDSIPAIAHKYLGQTSFLTSSELAEAIRHANGNRTANILKAGEEIAIPGILGGPIHEKPIPVAKEFEARAIYLTGVMAASDRGVKIVRRWREAGGNAVVFDIKDSDGNVNIAFDHPLNAAHHVYIHDLPKYIRFLHSENMHAIARIAMFRDERMVVEHPELAVQSKSRKQPWRENGKLVWTDPSQPKVQQFNIALAKYVAQLGADEIQFDYVRFPAEGDQKDAGFVYQGVHADSDRAETQLCNAVQPESPSPSPGGATDDSPGRKSWVAEGKGNKSRRDRTNPQARADGRKNGCDPSRGPQRSDVIVDFLSKAYAEIHPTGALLSLDVFGIMAWQRPVDLSHTGQDIVGMAKHCDVLSPMIYPSHFFGMDGIAHPGDAPEHFIGESMARFEKITAGTGVVIRPWLQAFRWRTKTYSPEYIKVQVASAKEKGGDGFLFWNAANDYSKPYAAMPEMKAANLKEKEKYFRGDELPGVIVKASLSPETAPPASASQTASH
jgi:hypothetical protein